jgi:hypothetical protein
LDRDLLKIQSGDRVHRDRHGGILVEVFFEEHFHLAGQLLAGLARRLHPTEIRHVDFARVGDHQPRRQILVLLDPVGESDTGVQFDGVVEHVDGRGSDRSGFSTLVHFCGGERLRHHPQTQQYCGQSHKSPVLESNRSFITISIPRPGPDHRSLSGGQPPTYRPALISALPHLAHLLPFAPL